LSSFRGMTNYKIIVVFDAYRVEGRPIEEISEHHNIYVVFTKEAQTADQYIEKFAFDHQKDYNITVATSDALQQVITRGAGTSLLSARELREVVLSTLEQTKSSLRKRQGSTRTSLDKSLSQEIKEQLKELHNGDR
ncbi:MAG: translation elongation factor G, partial [Firmicutes bacterium]|nr:translation elongation factor G [Bacillota bacterium]